MKSSLCLELCSISICNEIVPCHEYLLSLQGKFTYLNSVLSLHMASLNVVTVGSHVVMLYLTAALRLVQSYEVSLYLLVGWILFGPCHWELFLEMWESLVLSIVDFAVWLPSVDLATWQETLSRPRVLLKVEI